MGQKQKFDKYLVDNIYLNAGLLLHGLVDKNMGLAEQGIRDEDSYDKETIINNRQNAPDIMAEFLTTKIKKFIIVPKCNRDYDENFCGKSIGKIIIDEIGFGDEYYELSKIKLHTNNFEIILTLQTYGYKFEERRYNWFLTHIHKKKSDKEYDNDSFELSECDDHRKYEIKLVYKT